VDTRAFMAVCRAELGDEAGAAADAGRFLARFRRDIARDPRAAGADAVAWLLRVNPLRRDVDQAWLVDALARAGLRA
jgi:hypothetical protein